MKIKHIVSCFFVSLIGLSACSIEELPYNQLTEDELDGSYESLLSDNWGDTPENGVSVNRLSALQETLTRCKPSFPHNFSGMEYPSDKLRKLK